LNITYFDALGEPGDSEDLHRSRFLCSQAIPLALAGIPAVYLHSLLAGRNDLDGVQQTGRARSINRARCVEAELDRVLADPSTVAARVFAEYARLLRLRAGQPAFHPDAPQRVIDAGPACFAVEREARDGQKLLAVSNCTARAVEVSLPGSWTRDLVMGVAVSGSRLKLEPYQTAWLQ